MGTSHPWVSGSAAPKRKQKGMIEQEKEEQRIQTARRTRKILG